MKISKNFNLSEFAVSATASAKGHTIIIPEIIIPNIIILVENLLQPICDATGWHDTINSGFRDDFTNNLVGGVPNSQHRTGEAADNRFFRKDGTKKIYLLPIDVLKKVVELKLNFDQMIAYNGFVHLSYTAKRKNRKQILYNRSYTGRRL
ncbi:MAG: D-Ala-D-Ala carboxypeptidase family metallohydrolase [Dysgonomonas sp.]